MSRRSLTVRGVAAAALLPLALGSLSACGEDDGEPAASSETSETTKSAAETDADTADGADLAAGETVTKNDFMDLYRASVEDLSAADFTMDVAGDGMDVSAEGVVDYSTDPASMEMSYTGLGAGQDMDMIMVDNVMYMKTGQTGPKWITFDLEDAAAGMGMDLGAQMDMRQMLETFEKGLSEVVYVGEADVSGDETDQYRLTVDTQALMGELDLKGLGAGAAGQVPPTVDFDIFFDDDDRFRRMDLDLGKSGSMTMDFDNWGTDAEITAPPAGQTTSMEEMMGGLDKSGSAS